MIEATQKFYNAKATIDKENEIIYIDIFAACPDCKDLLYNMGKNLNKKYNMPIIFDINGFFVIEVNEKTIYEEFKREYELEDELYQKTFDIIYARNKFRFATRKLKEKNYKSIINRLYRDLLLETHLDYLKKIITIYDQKMLAYKMYRIYRENHKSDRIELLPPIIEIPKVMIKK